MRNETSAAMRVGCEEWLAVMKRENLLNLLLQKHPSQRAEIEERMAKHPDEVKNAHEILNHFRAKDPSLQFRDAAYYKTVFK